ncbi:PAS domain-containing protein [Lichenibacterium minor]|uniref:histidine kinase n=1 Tax=Lichenibacterium minor TaxID=2316528 RepID=A0A4Q2U421_9HYPH|nr:PAS domain-containing protein [Lichenibacterium minor]RYC29647.1 PAS domain-containing protein [Lichenibacterium minor]
MVDDDNARLRRDLAEAKAEIASLRQKASNASDARDAARIIEEITGIDNGTDPFAAAVKATRMPMVISNPRLPDNPIVFVNDAFCRLTGYPREEIVGRNCRFLQGPDTDRDTVARLRAGVDNRESIRIDILNYRKTGETFWNRLLMAPVRDAQGELAYFFASQVDVTLEREKVEGLESHNAALMAEVSDRLHTEEENTARLHFAAEAGRLGIWEHDLRTDALVTSGSTKENYGRDRTLPFTWEEMKAAVHPDDREMRGAAYNRSVEDGVDYDVEFRVLCPDGSTRWVHKRAQVLRGPDGTAVRMAGVCQDVTARREDENRRLVMLELADHIRDIEDPAALAFAAAEILGRRLGVSRAGFGVVDPITETITIERDWNAPGVHSLAGVLQFRDYGSYIEDLKRGDLVAFADARIDERTADGAEALEAISARAVLNLPVAEQSGFVALLYLNHAEARTWTDDEVALARDVADRVQVAVQRRRAESNLRQLAASLERQVEERTAAHQVTEEQLRQAQKMEAVGQLTGGLAHDFNNLLTGITGALDLIKKRLAQGRAADVGRYLDMAATSAGRAAALTHRLLAFSRRQTLDPKPTDVDHLISGMIDMVRRTVGPGIGIHVVNGLSPWAALVDPSQLENAILNLCINARDAMPNGGQITVKTENCWIDARTASARDFEAGPYLKLSVSDTGTGMPPDVIARAFDPFFTTKPLGQGTGLGLSMIYGFAKQSGGQVRIHSQPGEGTKVALYLPRHDGGITERGAPIEDIAAMPRAERGETVLVVDDEPAVRMLVADVLSDLGYVSVEAADGAAGLKILRSDIRVDLLVTDVGLPGGMNGRQVADAARVLRPALKVLFITGYAENAVVGNGNLDPGMAILTKPFAMDHLAGKIRDLIQS